MSQREVGTLVFLAAGAIILAFWVWALRGGSYNARRWMYTPLGSERTERMILFGLPVCGFGLLAFSAIALPERAFGLDVVSMEVVAVASIAGVVLLAALVVPLVYWTMRFIPMPDLLYPRWAREVRDDRRRFPQTSPHQPPHPKDRPGSRPR